MIPKRIKFKGEEYWLVKNEFCNYNISPLDHYTPDGELLADPFVAISYAIVENGTDIMQFGTKIGTFPEDIEYLD